MKNLFILFLCTISISVYAQNTLPNKLNVFYDNSNYGNNSFFDYIRQEMNKINFVRDREDADVHIMLKANYNSVGTQLTDFFVVGKKQFSTINDTIRFVIPPNSTDDEQRKILVKELKIALLPFIAKTTLVQDVIINLKNTEISKSDTQEKATYDPYNFWVFKISGNTNINGNKNFNEKSFSGYVSADRETEKSKINFFIYASNRKDKFTDENGNIYRFKFQENTISLDYAKKATPHFAYGFSSAVFSSTYSNIKSQINIGPKIEYSVFNYNKYNTKRWIFTYEIQGKNNIYIDTTIYNKTKETYTTHGISSIYSYTQPWGSVNVMASWKNLLRDFRKNNLSLGGAISTKIAKGLNFAVWGSYNVVQNQINISKTDPSLGNLLLKSNELLSSYSYDLSVGLSYRFGSKNNNVVNPVFNGMNYSINL